MFRKPKASSPKPRILERKPLSTEASIPDLLEAARVHLSRAKDSIAKL